MRLFGQNQQIPRKTELPNRSQEKIENLHWPISHQDTVLEIKKKKNLLANKSLGPNGFPVEFCHFFPIS